MDRLWFVLLPLRRVRADHLPDGHGVGEHAGDQSLQAVGDLIHPWVGLPCELPPEKTFQIPLLFAQRVKGNEAKISSLKKIKQSHMKYKNYNVDSTLVL